MKPFFTHSFISILFLVASNSAGAQTLDLSKTVNNITTAATGTLASENDILEYSIIVKNLSAINLTSAKLFDNIPAGSAYIAGSTRLNGTTISDVASKMPFTGTGATIQSPGSGAGVLRPNISAEIKFRVKVTANGGNISNYAIVECLSAGSAVVQNTNTVFTNLTPDPNCSLIYQSTAKYQSGTPNDWPYRYIKLLNTADGKAGATIYNGETGPCFNAITGAALSNGSILQYASAIAFDKTSNRIYFVNNFTTSAQDLCYIDLNTSPVSAKRFPGYPLETTTGTGYNVNRMSFASDGYGYAITLNGQDIIRFSINTVTGLPDITRLGPLLNAPSNGSNDILDERGGDIFGDGSGNLYLVANSSNLYKINPTTRVSTFLGAISPFPGTSNSMAIDAAGNVYVGGAYQNVHNVNLATMNASSITGGSSSNVWTNGDYTSCAFPVLAPALVANKTYRNINNKPFVIGGDTVEYRIEVSNTGNINAAGVKLYDAIPPSTNYIPGSTFVNGVARPDIGGAMPYSLPGGAFINTLGEQPGIIKPGSPNKVVLVFRARIDPMHYICNQSKISLLDDNGNTMFINSDDPGQPGGQNPTCFFSDGVLPASNISLKGKISGNVSNLSWSVTTDQDVKSYEVQFSADGYSFVTAGIVEAKSNGAAVNNYRFDDNLHYGTLRFYRLKLTGSNGLYTYSEIIRLSTDTNPVVTVTPNPFVKQLRISLQLKTSEEIRVRLIDFQGRTVLENKTLLSKGAQKINIDVPEKSSAGMYIIEIYTGKEKIFKQKLIRQ
jgi:uncharacterized repeat protein (TIGR01451 family)